jgi:uncharacterized protein (TIGR02284 family)
MAIDDKELRSTLEDLSEICKDGEVGYAQAADLASSAELKHLFLEYSQERGQLAIELHTALAELGGYPSDAGTISGTLHRAWMDLKSKVTHHDDKAIVAEAERAEQVAIHAYKKALEKDLPNAIRPIIEKHLHAIQNAHIHLQSVELKASTA